MSESIWVKDEENRVPVAIKRFKELDKELRHIESGEQLEIMIHHKLTHRNVVEMFGLALIYGEKALVMELCPCSLHDLIHKRSSEMTEKIIKQVILGIIEGMEHLVSDRYLYFTYPNHNLYTNSTVRTMS